MRVFQFPLSRFNVAFRYIGQLNTQFDVAQIFVVVSFGAASEPLRSQAHASTSVLGKLVRLSAGLSGEWRDVDLRMYPRRPRPLHE
jgi:hypothetical protein